MSEMLTCANHPDRETRLRCNRCGRPICSRCAVLTPVGYRCRECIRGQQTIFETAGRGDYLIAGMVSAIGIGLSAVVLSFLSFWGLLVAPVVGGGLAEVVRWAVRRRRSRHLATAAAVGGAIGLLPQLLLPLAGGVSSAIAGSGLAVLGASAITALWPIGTGAVAIGSLYYRLRGIRL
ncbi:MAG: B-box zinc finger protein [Chloroflexota bacterium]